MKIRAIRAKIGIIMLITKVVAEKHSNNQIMQKIWFKINIKLI